VDASQGAGSKTNANPASIAWARGDNMVEEAKWLVHQQELHAVLMGFKAFEPMLAKRMVECKLEGTEAQSYMNQLT